MRFSGWLVSVQKGRALALAQGCVNEIDKRQVVDFGRSEEKCVGTYFDARKRARRAKYRDVFRPIAFSRSDSINSQEGCLWMRTSWLSSENSRPGCMRYRRPLPLRGCLSCESAPR